jgi:hypothetical protein
LSNVFLVLHQKGMIWMMEKTDLTGFQRAGLDHSFHVANRGKLAPPGPLANLPP